MLLPAAVENAQEGAPVRWAEFLRHLDSQAPAGANASPQRRSEVQPRKGPLRRLPTRRAAVATSGR
eukprot:6639239-Alexandrium_andersonii.AAC.1